MTQLAPSEWDSPNNKSLCLTPDNPWRSKIPSRSSSVWTPRPYGSLFIGDLQHSPRAETFPSHSPPFCGVCYRSNCQLRSHRAYLSARQPRSQTSNQDLGFDHPCHAKPKVVDDQAIRIAFTKSYAFVEPSYLSMLQPSSFRLDGFHDLPVSNGDRPEMHKLLWDFLNNHLGMILGRKLQQTTAKANIHNACLAAAMSDANVCLCLLATEKMIQDLLPSESTNVTGSKPMSPEHFQHCLDFIQQHPIDFTSMKSISESIISLCLRLVLEIQGGTSITKSLDAINSDVENGQELDHFMPNPVVNEMKLLTFGSP